MKRLRFVELWLLSRKEKKARKESLNHDLTAVVADNDFGKSSLVKSLYYTLGADPTKTPEQWKAAQVVSLLKFSIDGEEFYMLRQTQMFTLFDKDAKRLWTKSGLVKGVGPSLAAMLDFVIELSTKSGDSITPPPAFCFLPFYVDQDNGWNDVWASFDGLAMIPSYKKDIAAFHTGIRPKEYYEAKRAKDAASARRAELRLERSALDRAERRLKEKRRPIGIGLDPSTYADRLDRLLQEQNSLQAAYDVVKKKVSDLQGRRVVGLEENHMARQILADLDADVAFLKKMDEPEIECPVCHTIHQNDFANRFGLMNDADACRMIFGETRQRIEDLDGDIKREILGLNTMQERIDSINSVLDEVRGEIKLRDLLEDESERVIDATFLAEGGSIDQALGEVDGLIEAADGRMKEFSSPTRKKEVLQFYLAKLLEFCAELGVQDIPDKIQGSVSPVITESGSSKPRLMLAFYYAILHTIERFSSACFCPVVVDTPLQQDPDSANAARMIKFAMERLPSQAQLVLATGSLHGATFAGQVIRLTVKRSLLSSDQFDVVSQYMKPFMDAALRD